MPRILALRREAEAEAARIRSVRARISGTGVDAPGEIPVTVLRTSAASGIDVPGAIFFVRARIVDGTGRLLEALLVPVRLPLGNSRHGRRRQDVRAHAQELVDRYEAEVRAAADAHLAGRMAFVAREYGQGLARGLRRELQLAERVKGDAAVLIQPGLFDRRALDDAEMAQQRRAAFAGEIDSRLHSLRAGPVARSAHQPEIVLLLILNGRA